MILIAIKAHCYAGRNINPGERYQAQEPYASVLVLANVSRRADEKTYETAEQKPEPIGAKKRSRKKRQYKRRDMNPKE